MGHPGTSSKTLLALDAADGHTSVFAFKTFCLTNDFFLSFFEGFRPSLFSVQPAASSSFINMLTTQQDVDGSNLSHFASSTREKRKEGGCLFY